jgi:hypothetical protein
MRSVLFGILLTACSHPRGPAKPMTDCRAAIDAFASADPTKLRALPATCTLADATGALTSLDATSNGMLGTRDHGIEIHYFSSAKLKQIRVWVDPAGKVVLLDTEWPPGAETAYLGALGDPEARLDYMWKGSARDKAELVWPSRGALVVAMSGVNGVHRVGVFAPTTLADYEASLRYVDIETDGEG